MPVTRPESPNPMKWILPIFLLATVAAHADDQLLANGGFEDNDLGSPDGWQSNVGFGTRDVALSKAAPHEGKTHLALKVITDNAEKDDGGPGTGPGRVAVEQVTHPGSITPGTTYILSCFSTSPTGYFPTVSPRYHIEWLDASNQPIGSSLWKSFAPSAGKDGFYEEFSTELPAPAGADHVRVAFDLEGGDLNNPDSVESVLYIDNVSLHPAKAGSAPGR